MSATWEKLGRIAAPPFGPPWALTHAALPVVDLAEPDSPLLYFSTRDEQSRARVARARLELDSAKVGVSEIDPEPVLELGELGAFDDRGTTTSCLVTESGRKYLYYSGWALGRTVPFYLCIGLAISEDGGRTFVRGSRAPVLGRSDVDPFLTASPWVLVEDGTWRMWYVSGTGWTETEGEPRHSYLIKYCESRDGIEWSPSGRVCIDFGPGEYALARPCVIKDDGVYRMWFAARGESYRLAYAESGDGIEWSRKDADAGLAPSSSGWDAEMVEYPLVFDYGGSRHMLYNGNGYGATGVGHAVRRER